MEEDKQDMARIGRLFKTKKYFPPMNRRLRILLTAGVLAALPFAESAQADLVVSFSPIGAVAAGSTGDSFDVLLTNTGSAAVSLGVFTFEVATTSTDITLTDATTATVADPYIFGSNSLIGPDILGATTGQDLTAFDLDSAGVDATVAAGATVGLGHVLFDVASTASSGSVDLELVSAGTSLSTLGGSAVTIQTLSPGQLQTTGGTNSVPEPSAFALLISCVALCWGWERRRMRHGLN